MIDVNKAVDSYKDKTILITGASGLLGSHILNLLPKSTNIKILTRQPIPSQKNIDVFHGEITNYDLVEKAVKDTDIIFHLAAIVNIDKSIQDPYNTFNTNVLGTLNVLECTRKQLKTPKIIFSSSTNVYRSSNEAITEESPIKPSDPYSTSKVVGDFICQTYMGTYNLPITILRTSSIYGPNQPKTQFIPKVITQSLLRSNLEIGSLSAYRDFCYVKDASMAFLLAGVTKTNTSIFNISYGKSIKLTEIVDKIFEILGKKLEIKSTAIRSNNSSSPFTIDSSKAQTILHWTAHYDIDRGLRETIEWFKNESPM